MSGQIFISYRREDNSYPAGRLYDRLSAHFPQDQIFIDVDTIERREPFGIHLSNPSPVPGGSDIRNTRAQNKSNSVFAQIEHRADLIGQSYFLMALQSQLFRGDTKLEAAAVSDRVTFY
jgi:hypothetical protein